MPQDSIPYADIPAPSANPISLVTSALKAARPVVCQAYRVSPGFFTAEVDTSLPGVQQLHAKDAMDAYCGPDPGGLPPNPPSNPPFTGGQCPGVYQYDSSPYDVLTVNHHHQSGDGGGGVLYGPIVGIYVRQGFLVIESKQPDHQTPQYSGLAGGGADPVASGSGSLVNLRRVDGQPDSCGSLPAPGYTRDPSQTSPIYNNVSIDDRDNSTYSSPITIFGNVGGTVAFDVGGFRFQLGSTGVDVSPSPLPPDPTKLPDPSNPPPPPNSTRNPPPAPPTGQSCQPGGGPPPSPTTHNVSPQPPAAGKSKDGLARLAYVKIDTTIGYKNVDVQAGSSPPNVLYHVGWFWFSIGGYMCERQPIDTYAKLFIAPAGADGYTYSLLPGATAVATEYTLKE